MLRDKDGSDCHEVKASLVDKMSNAGRADSMARIACHELESFYLGDLAAVEVGLEIKNISQMQDRRKYRTPDKTGNAAEEMFKLTFNAYQKIAGSRAISTHLALDGSNRSRSFNVLVEGIREIIRRIDER